MHCWCTSWEHVTGCSWNWNSGVTRPLVVWRSEIVLMWAPGSFTRLLLSFPGEMQNVQYIWQTLFLGTATSGVEMSVQTTQTNCPVFAFPFQLTNSAWFFIVLILPFLQAVHRGLRGPSSPCILKTALWGRIVTSPRSPMSFMAKTASEPRSSWS